MRRRLWWAYRLGKSNAGEVGGQPAISPRKIVRVAAEGPLFPPLDQALIQAMAREVIAETKLPLSRQSLADLGAEGFRAEYGREDEHSGPQTLP